MTELGSRTLLIYNELKLTSGAGQRSAWTETWARWSVGGRYSSPIGVGVSSERSSSCWSRGRCEHVWCWRWAAQTITKVTAGNRKCFSALMLRWSLPGYTHTCFSIRLRRSSGTIRAFPTRRSSTTLWDRHTDIWIHNQELLDLSLRVG